MLNRSFWKSRRVLLTGHTGFKGSWLSLWLDALGANVTGYALDSPTQPNLFERASIASSLRSVCGDIRDFPRLKSVIAECHPEVVIHMAAQSVVRRGYEDPIETYSSNVMGTVNLVEALRQLNIHSAHNVRGVSFYRIFITPANVMGTVNLFEALRKDSQCP